MFAAYQMAFDRRVAIKVLNDRLADDESVAAFERECQAMGALSRHPFIVTVLASAFTADYRPCIVMDLFEQGNYMQLVRQDGPLPVEELLSVGVRVAGALATAHGDGVIHGDVKPQNIFKSAFGFPALGDFGIATLRSRATERVGLGMSPHFVAPELIEGGAAEAAGAADQYSLGATLYTLATGRRPFESDTPQAPQQVLAQALEAPTPTLPDGFPRDLAAALRRAMARGPRDRYGDLGAFAVVLANIEHRLGYRPTPIPIAGIDDDATIAIDKDTLTALRQQTPARTTEPAPPPEGPDAPTTDHPPPRQTPDTPANQRSHPKRRRLLLGALALLLAAAGAASATIRITQSSHPVAPNPPLPTSAAAISPPVAAPVPNEKSPTPPPTNELQPPEPPQPAPNTEPPPPAAASDPPTPPPAVATPEDPPDDELSTVDQPEPAEQNVFKPTEEWPDTLDDKSTTTSTTEPPSPVVEPEASEQTPPPPTSDAESSWSVNDEPELSGPPLYWFHGELGRGYGTNNYRYTLGINGEPEANNRAHWYMGNRVGRQELQVFVPTNHATATVNYNIYMGGQHSRVSLAQRNISGWHSLGEWNTNGADVVIAVFDNDVEQHHERDGETWSSIGVDAVRMRCVAACR